VGSFKNESTSCTWLLLCGVNTSCRCSAKICRLFLYHFLPSLLGDM
jgi:dolichyl-phosphate-mannose--protein O-mannosyl transferase